MCQFGDPVAQQVEHLTFNQGAAGSNPARGTRAEGARVAELADALDLESSGLCPCGFKSHLSHQ